MTERYLWSPLRLGPVTVATASSSARTSRTTPTTACRPSSTPPTTRRAPRAAAGLIITEEHSTHPTDWPYEKLIHGFHRDVIPGYRRITEAVHRHRTPIFAQINHNGGQASSMYTPAAGVGAVAGRRPAVPRGAQGGRRGRDRRDRRRLRARRRALRRGRLRRHRAAVLPLLDRARLPVAGHQPAHRRATAARSTNRARLLLEIVAAVRGAIGQRPGARRAHLRRRADRGRHHDRRGRRGGRSWSRRPATSTTSTPRSAWPPPACS